MQFYTACVQVAERVLAEYDRETVEQLAGCERYEALDYYETVGLWIQERCLRGDDFLHRAFHVLGMNDEGDMALFLLEFLYIYVRLKRGAVL